MTDRELDNAIVFELGVQRAEHRTGHSMHRGLTANELALSTGQPLERVKVRLAKLARADRVTAPIDNSQEWASHRPDA